MYSIFYYVVDIIGTLLTQVVLWVASFNDYPATTLETEPQPLLKDGGFAFYWIKNIWRDEWWDFVVMRSFPRYFLALVRSIWVLFASLRRSITQTPHLRVLDDKQLGIHMRNNYCHLMKKVDDDSSPKAVKEYAKNSLGSGHYVYLDCSFMGLNPKIESYPGTYFCGTITIFKTDATNLSYIPVAIQIIKSASDQFWVTPSDNAWSIAKRFAFNTAHYLVTFNTHPLTHFPQDCVYYHLRENMPQNHWLRQLLTPHFRFSASVTDSVFYNKFTVFNTIGIHAWSIPVTTVLQLLHHDLKDYTWTPILEEPSAESPHSIARALYHKTILDFVEKIIAANSNSGEILDGYVTQWIDKVAKQLNGFPDSETVRKRPHLLAESLSKIILIVSFDHTTDHWWIRMRDPTIIEWIIRTPPPQNAQDAGIPSIRWKRDLIVQDFFNWCLPFGIFTYIPLCDVKYPFENSLRKEWMTSLMEETQKLLSLKPLQNKTYVVKKEQEAAKEFRRELRVIAKIAEERGFEVPLEIVSASVEY